MSAHTGRIEALDWKALVDEALRRRKAEKMTQRQHAALAGVSIPTIVAFDRGERTLSLAKAFDILRVVGLVVERGKEGAQEAFVQAALARWRELTAKLPAESPARFPHGWYRFDYALEGELKEIELHRFEEVLSKAEIDDGWPVFWVAQKEDLAPRQIDGVLEAWFGKNSLAVDPAYGDFWRAAPEGRMVLLRGYVEDGRGFEAGTILDIAWSIQHMAQTLLHAARLASLMKRDDSSAVTVKFHAHYTGLTGRVLTAINPLKRFGVAGKAARSDEALLSAEIPAAEIRDNMATHVFPLVSSLCERFGANGLSFERVQDEVNTLLRRWNGQ